MTPHTFGPLAVIGGGTMAESIIRGGMAAGVLDASHLVVCEPSPVRRAILEGLGVRAVTDHHEVARTGWPLLLAIKPQSLPELSSQLRPHLGDASRLVISILAGTPAATIQQSLGPAARVVRVMPNTAAAVRRSMSTLCLGPGATPDDLRLAERLFGSIGLTALIDESMMDAATAVVGSGPAYVYLLAQAMIDGASDVGFDPATADRLVRGTIDGAAAMLTAAAAISPESLRAGVTSKGGTTAAAVATLEKHEVSTAFRRAILAARDRGRELAKLAATT